MRNKWNDYENWKGYGIENGFGERNPNSLMSSKKKIERSWFNKGKYKKWLKNFKFHKKRDKSFRFDNFESWKEYGLNKEFNNKYPSELIDSENKSDRSWYKCGSKSNWIKKFKFREGRRGGLQWQDYEEWKKYGLENFYDKKNKRSLEKSEDKEERSWYRKGEKHKWISNFQFIDRYQWKNLDYVVDQAQKIMKENSWDELPAPKILIKLGYSRLSYSISRHHGGFHVFREKLNEYLGQKSETDKLESMLEKYIGGQDE